MHENENLNKEYLSILNEMETAREKALSNATRSDDTLHDRRVKFFAGAGLWYTVAVVVLWLLIEQPKKEVSTSGAK